MVFALWTFSTSSYISFWNPKVPKGPTEFSRYMVFQPQKVRLEPNSLKNRVNLNYEGPKRWHRSITQNFTEIHLSIPFIQLSCPEEFPLRTAGVALSPSHSLTSYSYTLHIAPSIPTSTTPGPQSSTPAQEPRQPFPAWSETASWFRLLDSSHFLWKEAASKNLPRKAVYAPSQLHSLFKTKSSSLLDYAEDLTARLLSSP